MIDRLLRPCVLRNEAWRIYRFVGVYPAPVYIRVWINNFFLGFFWWWEEGGYPEFGYKPILRKLPFLLEGNL